MPKLDLVIRGGELVSTSGSLGVADLGITGEVIAQIGGEIEGEVEIDGRGKLVIPGGVDAHVHLSYPQKEDPGWVDDFTSGSAAALAGGITTLGNMTFPLPGERPLQSLAREESLARNQAIADFFLHPVIDRPTREVLDEIPHLFEAGCNTIKIFTVSPWFDSQLVGYLEAIRRAGEGGLLSVIHCEDYAIIDDATQRLVAAGLNSLSYYPQSRPVISEVVATQRAVALAEVTGAPVYIVHLSSARALDVCAEAQSRGLPVYVETRPLYLHLTRECFQKPDGAKYVGQPPLREPSDQEALWTGINQGLIQTVCTDHAPWSLAAKLDPTHTLTNLRPGVANLQTMLPMLYSEGVRTGRLSLSRFVQVSSTNAARLFGLYPRKGTIAVGSDADLVVFDPERTRTIAGSMLKSNSDYSAFEGWNVTGWPALTLRRGEVVFSDDEVTSLPGSGKLIPRGKTLPL
ncbi:MAG: dihydropyrimidinase [Anaerolineales bacterium]|jgi:dihydropyrimidinase